jgi:hypothetical protein
MVQGETLDQDSTESDKGSVADESGLPANDSDETDDLFSRLTKTPDVMSFAAPAGSRGGNRTFIYEFSETVLFRPNPLYPPRSGRIVSQAASATTVTATCPGKPDIRVALSESQNAKVQRPSPTRLVYPATDISTPEPNSQMSTKVGLPLPMTLEELYSGTTKEAVVFRTNRSSEEDGRRQVILNIHIDAGMIAGQEIQATAGRSPGHRERSIVFNTRHVTLFPLPMIFFMLIPFPPAD